MGQTEILAREILEVIPAVMNCIRDELRGCRGPDLSVPQFRSLVYINHHPHTSLSDVAEHVGLTLPSASKLIDGLYKRGLVERDGSQEDRRRIALCLTPKGSAHLVSAISCAQENLSRTLDGLQDLEREALSEALGILTRAFL